MDEQNIEGDRNQIIGQVLGGMVVYGTMNTLLRPSSLISKGLRVEQIDNLTLFKFTDELGDRLQVLLDKKKADILTLEEAIELESIGELDDIFSYINAEIAAKANGHL